MIEFLAQTDNVHKELDLCMSMITLMTVDGFQHVTYILCGDYDYDIETRNR